MTTEEAVGASANGQTRTRKSVFGWIERIVDYVNRAALYIGGIAVLGMAGVTIVDVIMRNFVGTQLPGTLAMVTYWFMPVLSFCAMGAAYVLKAHIRVSLLGERAGTRLRWFIEMFADLVTVIVVVMIGVYTLENADQSFLRGQGDSAYPWVVLGPPKLFVAIAFLLYGITTFIGMIRNTITLITGSDADESDVLDDFMPEHVEERQL